MSPRRFLPILLPVLLLLAGCFHEPTPAQRAASFEPLSDTHVQEVSLADYTARRSVYLLSTLSGDFVTDRPGHLVLTNVQDGTHEVRLFTGTAVVLSDDGYLLTAAHCAATPNLTVIPPYVASASFGAFHPRIVWFGKSGDPLFDLAILKVDAAFPAHFTWSDNASFGHRSTVALAGIDLTRSRLGFSYAAGRILDPDWMSPDDTEPPIHAISHTAPLRRGDSGGPLLTPDGQLVAINVAVRYGIGPQFSVSLRPNPLWVNAVIQGDRQLHPAAAPELAAAHPPIEPHPALLPQ